MLSESARATAASESRYRVGAPNSRRRAVVVVALDAPARRIVAGLAPPRWTGVRFLTDPADLGSGVGEAVAGADLVVLVATAGEDPPAADLVGAACRARRITTTALVVAGDPTGGAAPTLARLRPWADVMVVPASPDYLADLLVALHAEPERPGRPDERVDLAGARP